MQQVRFLYTHDSFYGGLTEFVGHLLYSTYTVGKEIIKPTFIRFDHYIYDYFGYRLWYTTRHVDYLRNARNEHFFVTGFKNEHMDSLICIHPSNEVTIVVHGTQDLNEDSIAYALRNDWRIITIRKALQDYYEKKYGVNMIYLPLPFYKFPKNDNIGKRGAVSISRIGFDKNIKMMTDANKLITNHKNQIKLYGHISQYFYVETIVGYYDLTQYYHGEYGREFNYITDIVNNKKFLVNLTFHAEDGGGVEYAMLQAMYHDCCLIVNRRWIENVDPKFRDLKEGYNCLAVDNEKELAEILNKDPDVSKMVGNTNALFYKHASAGGSWRLGLMQ